LRGDFGPARAVRNLVRLEGHRSAARPQSDDRRLQRTGTKNGQEVGDHDTALRKSEPRVFPLFSQLRNIAKSIVISRTDVALRGHLRSIPPSELTAYSESGTACLFTRFQATPIFFDRSIRSSATISMKVSGDRSTFVSGPSSRGLGMYAVLSPAAFA